MLRLRTFVAFLLAGLSVALAAELPLVAVEGEHARRLRGPARLRRDSAASLFECVELMGERAVAHLDVRVDRAGPYTAWARARSASPQPAALSARCEGQEALNAAVSGDEWHWVKLGAMPMDRGVGSVQFTGTGTVRLDQFVLAGDPAFTPSGVADTSKSLRTGLPEVYFADNFMRTQREAGAWQTLTGTWLIRELTVRERFDATRSANAFSYLGTGTPEAPALAITGYPFWRNYSMEAAVRCLADESFGLVVLRQNEKDYYLLRYLPREGRFELLRCLDGVTDQLASCPGRLAPGRWYHLRLDACDGELAASVDGHGILRAVDYTFLTGQPGIWSAGKSGVFFDDVLVRSYQRDVERFHDAGLAGWEAEGAWNAGGMGLSGKGRLVGLESYTDFDAEVGIRLAEEAGLLYDWRDASDYAAVAFAAAPRRVEIREVRDGKPSVLASAPLPEAQTQPLAVRVSGRAGRVWVYVDGRLVLGAFRPDSAGGRVGLFGAGEGEHFTRLEIAHAQTPPPNMAHNRIFAGEDTMVAWASEGSDWQLTTAGPRNVAWHEIEHWGDCAVRYDFQGAAALPGKLGLAVRGDGQSAQSGYQLIAEPQGESPAKLTLLLGTQVLGTAKAPSPAVRTIELAWHGRCAVARVDGKLLLWHRAPKSPAGRRVAIWTEGWTPVLGQTSVESAGVLDDYFEAAAVDWRAESGAWAMQNRWTCSPQWSWMGGSSPEVAMLWNKHLFRGDISVDFYAAFQMSKVDARIYRPRDLNVTICADGRNPSSGYTFLYGGWNNTATALLRGESVVATTSAESKRPPTLLDFTPDMNHLHRKWWHINIQKHGPRITCTVDDELVLDYTDPKPLEGRSVCLWTHDDAIMVARACIAYEACDGMDAPLLAPETPAAPSLDPPPAVKSSQPLVLYDFEGGLGDWKGAEGSSRVALEARGDGLALAVTNPHAGGCFEVAFPFKPFNAMALPRLTFDYRIPPHAKVNLHVKMNDRLHAVVLTNPEARIAGIPILGAVDVQADDQWHTADVDLRALLLHCYPAAAELPVQEIELGTHDLANYLTAGFGGNYAGLTYHLDNVRLWSPGPRTVELSWEPKLAVSYALDQKADTVPDDTPEQGSSLKSEPLADGAWFFHAKARGADGKWSRTAHIPVVVDGAPPRVAAASPAQGAKAAPDVVTLDFADESGVDPKGLAITLAGHPYPVQVVPTDPSASVVPEPVTFDPAARRLSVDLGRLPVVLEDGQTVKLAVTSVKDFLGQAMEPYELSWVNDRSQDKEPPRDLRLESSQPYLCYDDFESSLGQWSGTPEQAIVERDDSTKATGRYSLRVHCPYYGGNFPATIRSEPFDAGRYPIVAFDYKMPINVRVDLVLTIGGTEHTVRFTDPHGSSCIGAIPGVKIDNQWHHTEFNLHEMLTTALPKAPSYVVSSLRFADTGYEGNAKGVEYHIDNFYIAPAASTRNAPIQWKLVASDPSGVPAYQYSLTSLPAAIEWHDSTAATWQFRDLGAGIFHFLARARDGAGNWSDPIHRIILIDDQPPDIRAIDPQPGSRAADARIRVTLADGPAGINRDKTTLTIGGVTYTTSQDGVTYDARTHTLTWAAADLAKPVALPNGQDVQVALNTEDNVGNAATKSWTWKMDYSLDKTPPPAPYVTCIPANPLVRGTFETDVEPWHPYGSYATLSRTTASATGRHALRITATRSQRYFGAYAYRASFDAMKHPMISFDYRMPAGLPMNLHLYTASSWRTIRLTSPTSNYTVVGAVPLTADNEWHHVDIDLLKYLKPESGNATTLPIRYVLFADFATGSTQAGTSFDIDNFTIAPRETGQNIQFEWTSVSDPTGIPGYAWAVDQKPDTQPAELKGTECAATVTGLAPGNWFFHVRTRDGAGNWGPAVHFPTTVLAPPATPVKEQPKSK